MNDSLPAPELKPGVSLHAPPASNRAAAPADPNPLELEVYKILATLFNSEETSFWARNNILVAVQGGLVAASIAILSRAKEVLQADAHPHASELLFGSLAALAFVGWGMAIAWIYMAGRSERIANTISGQLKEIEKVFERRFTPFLPSTFQPFQTFSYNLNPNSTKELLVEKRWNNRIRLSTLWQWVGWGLMWFWFVVLAVFLAFTFRLKPLTDTHPGKSALSAEEQAVHSAELAASSALRAALAAETAASAALAATSRLPNAPQASRSASLPAKKSR